MALSKGALIWVMCGGICGLLACAAQEKKEAPVVKDLKIKGNRQISSRQIEKKILTADTGWWPFATKHRFDPFAWQADLKRIERLYVSRGFYQAEVVEDHVEPLPENRVALEVQVSEGQPTHIGSIEIEGLDTLPEEDRRAALNGLPLASGAAFTEGNWARAKELLLTRLRDRGYAKADLDGQALVDVTTHRAALTIAVRPGVRYVFGDIHVKTGRDARISPVWIWEQARLALPEGKRTSDDALDEAQRRVFGMGVFSTVKVTAEEPDPATGRMPVLVDARESPFRTLRLGVGLRVDAIREEARLIGEWVNRDFLGGMRKLTLHAEAGWAVIPESSAGVVANPFADGARNGPIARMRAELEQPRLAGRPSLRGRATVEGERTLEQAYDALVGRFMTGVIWQVRSRLSLFPSYHLEGDYLNGPPISSAASSPLTLGCNTSSDHCFVWLSYLEQTLTWDRRDNPLEPRRGVYLALSLQEGGGPLGGDFDYLRALPEARGYLSFGEDKDLTLSARLRAGDLWTRSGNPGDSAVVTRFYGGGGVSMRGFNDRRLSPLLQAPAPGNPGVTLTLPIGGNGIIDGSFEARYSITPALRIAAFVDFGQVTQGPLGPDDVAHVLWAVGVGIRYLTPIGPIRLDIARRLPYGRLPPLFMISQGAIVPVTYDPDDSCFGLGGSHHGGPVTDGLCVLHISIGEAF